MLAELVDALVWMVRLALILGLCWGAWLSFGPQVRPAASPQRPRLERFATFALLVLLLTTMAGILHAG